MSEPVLKACPFCATGLRSVEEIEGGMFVVGCSCGVQGPPAYSEVEATEEWNCRRQSPQEGAGEKEEK